MAKGIKTGGRIKGSKNRHSFNAEELANQLNCDPLEILLRCAKGDWRFFGFENENKVIIGTKAGIEFSLEEPNLKMSDRVQSAKESCKYLYSQKRTVELSNPDGTGFKITVEDYTGKK